MTHDSLQVTDANLVHQKLPSSSPGTSSSLHFLGYFRLKL